jgi:hypothetical protein
MSRITVPRLSSTLGCLLLAGLSATGPVASSRDLNVVWVVVGDAVTSSGGNAPSEAGRHLFMATDLAEMSLKQVSVTKVSVDPPVSSLSVGQRFCLTSLRIAASGRDRTLIKRAPLTVSVRQDHRDALALESGKEDICVRPAAAGEYPIRFTSLLPAPDGSTRVTQIFLRVQEATASDLP